MTSTMFRKYRISILFGQYVFVTSCCCFNVLRLAVYQFKFSMQAGNIRSLSPYLKYVLENYFKIFHLILNFLSPHLKSALENFVSFADQHHIQQTRRSLHLKILPVKLKKLHTECFLSDRLQCKDYYHTRYSLTCLLIKTARVQILQTTWPKFST